MVMLPSMTVSPILSVPVLLIDVESPMTEAPVMVALLISGDVKVLLVKVSYALLVAIMPVSGN